MSRSNQLAGLLTADPPSALDTINEINTALGNDAALSTTLTDSIATKMPLAGGTFTGNVGVDSSPLATHSDSISMRFGGLGNIISHKASASSKSLNIANNVQLDTDGSYERIIENQASLYSQYNGTHTFYVAGSASAGSDITFTTGIKIDATGNVGIGTASPIAPLHVESASSGIASLHPDADDLLVENSGAAGISINGSGSDGCNIFFGDSGNASDGRITFLNTVSAMTFHTNSGLERMRIDSSGTVQITDANAGSQQSTQDFKIGRATIQVGNVDTTSSTSYGAGFTFKTYDYNGSSFVNHDALRITARGDVVVGHDNYIHGTAHDPNEGSHGTALLKTNGDFVQTGGDYDPRSGNSQQIFTPYHRRTMVSNYGRTAGQSQDMWYMWYKIDGVDGIYANGSTPYIELRVIGHSGHHSGSITRVIMINPCSNDTGHGSLVATQMGKNEASRGYGQTLDVYLYGNTNGANDVYMLIGQGQREPHVTIIADLYSCTRNMHSINNFGITYYGGGSATNTTEPSNVGTGRATFNN